jgi:hypothetical protein
MKKRMLLFMVVMVLSMMMLAGQALADTDKPPITVTGTILSISPNFNEFVLTLDEAGAASIKSATIPVDAGPSWYAIKLGLAVLKTGMTVTVTGELGTGKDGTKAPELDAFTITPEGGTEIKIKGPGRPPWAGGPKGKKGR